MCDCTEYNFEELEAREEVTVPEKVAVPLQVQRSRKR
jgi:hypothetical protein